MIDRMLLRRLLRGAGAVFVLTMLLVGVPAALFVLVGSPLPHALPTWEELRSALTANGIPDDVLVKALAVVCWGAWALLTASVTAEVVGVVRGRGAGRIPFAGPLQTLAANLVAAIVLSLSPVTSRVAAAPPLTAAVVLTTSQGALRPERVVSACPPESQLQGRSGVEAADEEPRVEMYTVRRWDTLWGIAEAHLGDPLRWPELFELNRGRPQPDGGRLTEPGLIRPGWQLQVPVSRPAPPPASPTPAPSGSPPDAQPRMDSTPETPGIAEAGPSSTAAAPTTTTPESVPRATAPSRPERPVRPPATELRRPDGGPSVRLPGGSVVSLWLAAGIGTSLAAARLHRRRRRVPAEPRPGLARTDPLASQLVRRLRQVQLDHVRPTRRARVKGPGPPADDSAVQTQAERPVGVVSLSERAGASVEVDLIGLGGLALEGDGALAMARAVVIDLVSNAGPGTAEVVVAGSRLLDELAPGLAPFTGLEVVPDLDAALTRLEIELVHRTRILDADEDTEVDFASYVGAHPEEPLPALV